MQNMISLALLPIIFYILPICVSQTQTCEKRNDTSGVISGSQQYSSSFSKCWSIAVPENSYIRLEIKELGFRSSQSCSTHFVKITVAGTNEIFTYCYQDSTSKKPVTALSDVNITYNHDYNRYSNSYSSSFKLNYTIESLVCAHKNHFRCSPSSCVHQYQVCDGVKDCENGADEAACENGISGIRGMNISREDAITWLKNQRSASFGWDKNTHRAITALYLAKAVNFTGESLEEELMVKQLELQASVALLRNTTDPISVSELSMFVNALTVTCHNPRQFYGHDLLQILRERVSMLKSPCPGAYLTLCNSNWTMTESDVKQLLKPLHSHSKYPFMIDVQAVAVMALSCVKSKMNKFRTMTSAESFYEKTVKEFIAGQHSDGSFGNVYTTALVTQALIASGQEKTKKWNMTATARYLMQQLNSSSVDFLSTYLTLPIFKSRSLVDITRVDCSNITRKQGQDNEISDVTSKLGGKMQIQYSLYIGDQKDVIHTLFLRMPENSTAYDVMRVAQVADPKYKFLHRDVSGQMYVYEIAGVTNDPEAGKFWLLYTDNKNETIKHHTTSPDKFVLKSNVDLIMWYRTADI